MRFDNLATSLVWSHPNPEHYGLCQVPTLVVETAVQAPAQFHYRVYFIDKCSKFGLSTMPMPAIPCHGAGDGKAINIFEMHVYTRHAVNGAVES